MYRMRCAATALRSVSVLVVALAGLFVVSANASATELGTFRDWAAHEIAVDGQTICFMDSRPTSLDPKGGDRAGVTVRVTVTNRPARDIFAALLFETGYQLDEKVPAEISIDGNVYLMGTDATGYFYLSEEKAERHLLEAMKGGAKLQAKGTMLDGTPVTDAYSLYGFTAALKAIDTACPR